MQKTLEAYVESQYGLEESVFDGSKEINEAKKAWGIVKRLRKKCLETDDLKAEKQKVVKKYKDKHKFLSDTVFQALQQILGRYNEARALAVMKNTQTERRDAMKAALKKKKEEMVEWRKNHELKPRPRRAQMQQSLAFETGQHALYEQDEYDDEY